MGYESRILFSPLHCSEWGLTAELFVQGPYLVVKHQVLCGCLYWHGDGGKACHPR